jgi:S1-C subfamily serine protease
MTRTLTILALLTLAPTARASDPLTATADEVNTRVVKLFGAGGFRGVANYGSGVIVSPDGHILTLASQMLDTSELIVHLYDGRRMKATVVAAEPELDVALLRILVEGKSSGEPTGLNLPFFDIAAAAKRPPAAPGDWVIAHANEFEIAMRDEPVSVQRGVIAAVSKLSGRKGIFDFGFTGNVYVVDAITNNPGAGGGALTDTRGRLLGLVGRELKNSLTETWINYAVPINATAELRDGDKVTTITIPEFAAKAMKGEYKTRPRVAPSAGPVGYHGIVFVPNVLERTPPYVETCVPGSPAARAGLRPDDLVSFVDGEPVASIKAFDEAMRKVRPGTTVRLEVRRGDGLQAVELKLEAPPKPATPAARPPAPPKK